MSDLNTYTATGRLGADAEVKYATSGTAVWSARIGVGYGYGERKGTNWITVKVFGKQAESLGKLNLAKGAAVGVSGELQVREFDRKDGTKGTSVEVNANSVALLSPKPADTGNGGRSRPAPADNLDDGGDNIPFITNQGRW